jgi:TolB protein
LLILLGISLLACRAVDPRPTLPEPGDISSEAAKVSVDRITYLDAAGDIFTVKGDGSDHQRLTGGTRIGSGPTGPFLAQGLNFDNVHAWPTWAPDGSKLAASRIRVTGDQSAELTVQVLDAVTGRSSTVFSNNFPGLVAEGSPHYLYWSPDSRSLSFLASAANGLDLLVVDTVSGGDPIVIERGAPLYYSWAGDGSSLLVHIGEEVKLFRELSDHVAGEPLATARGFRVPAFSSDGRRVAYAVHGDSGESLSVAEAHDVDNARQVLDLGAFSAFMWSPDGSELAVADQQSPNSVVFERLRIVAADGESVRTITEDPVLAFYWSPNGERIAWVALDQENRRFEWRVIPSAATDASRSRALFAFNPSRDVLTMLSFFDQYAYSHSPWSPDSTRLVVAGTQAAPFERRNGHTPTGARVFVIDAVGDVPPREIAEGILAFWSWN